MVKEVIVIKADWLTSTVAQVGPYLFGFTLIGIGVVYHDTTLPIVGCLTFLLAPLFVYLLRRKTMPITVARNILASWDSDDEFEPVVTTARRGVTYL